MRKVLLSLCLFSTLALTACPSPNASNPANPLAGGTTKVTKAMVLKYFDCVTTKLAPEQKVQFQALVAQINAVPDAQWDAVYGSPQVIQGMTQAYAALGCGLM